MHSLPKRLLTVTFTLGFQMGHGNIQVENRKGELVEKSLEGKIVEVDEHGELVEAGFHWIFQLPRMYL